jgi:hypothetical protein
VDPAYMGVSVKAGAGPPPNRSRPIRLPHSTSASTLRPGARLRPGGLGEADEAFRWLEAAYEERASFMDGLAVTTGFDAIRSDPRFAQLLRRMGLES